MRFLSKQAIKAVPRPDIRLSISTTCQIRQIQKPPYTRPDLDTIPRRLSPSQVDHYFTRKHKSAGENPGEDVK